MAGSPFANASSRSGTDETVRALANLSRRHAAVAGDARRPSRRRAAVERRSASGTLNERGLVWLLHGEPTNHRYLNQVGAPANPSWQFRGENGALELQAAERATGDRSILRGETESKRYERPLDAQVAAIAIGSDPAGQLLQVAFAIPGTSFSEPPMVRRGEFTVGN